MWTWTYINPHEIYITKIQWLEVQLSPHNNNEWEKKTNDTTPNDDHILDSNISSWFWNRVEQNRTSIFSPHPPLELCPHMTGTCPSPAGDPIPSPPCRTTFLLIPFSAGDIKKWKTKDLSMPINCPGGREYIYL